MALRPRRLAVAVIAMRAVHDTARPRPRRAVRTGRVRVETAAGPAATATARMGGAMRTCRTDAATAAAVGAGSRDGARATVRSRVRARPAFGVGTADAESKGAGQN